MKGRGSLVAMLAGLTALGLMLGCERIPGKPTEAQRPLIPSQVSNFDALYGHSCAGCHGGDGQLGAARPLRDPLYLALVHRDTLRQIIAQGVPGTTMPAFSNRFGGELTDQQIDIVIDGMQNRWGRPQAFTNVTLPPYSREDAAAAGAEPGDLERGKAAYTTYCAHCHGPDGGGGEKGGAVVDGVYLALVSDQALRTAVIAGRVDLGMPDWREEVAGQPMTPQDIADVVAWLASHRQRLPGRLAGSGQGRE
jgi:cytochrome c oxidase cbb3-type subunit 3